MTLYFSHIRLSKTPSTQALAALLLPTNPGKRISAQHNLLWSAFADSAERKRDFLWREERDGGFLTLSSRPPLQTDLFEPHQVKEYAPSLTPGEKLDILLRVNATRMKPRDDTTRNKKHGKRVDVVMDALAGIPRGEERAAQRMEIATSEGKAWLERQGEKSGFRVIKAVADDYSTVRLPRPGKSFDEALRLGILDLTGRIEITDSTLFLTQTAEGFGRAKAFGCGLMLIRRAK
jgi:CRISPR system Cascade subunit CasE